MNPSTKHSQIKVSESGPEEGKESVRVKDQEVFCEIVSPAMSGAKSLRSRPYYCPNKS